MLGTFCIWLKEDTLTESEFEGCGGTNGDNGDDERDHKGSKTNARKSHTAPKTNPAVEKSEKGVPISGTCKVGGSSSTGRAPEQVRYDQIMADIADLQAKMILWISLENSFWSLSFVPHPALHDVRYYHITKPFQLYICPSIDLAQEYGSYWLLGVCLYSQTRKRYIDIYLKYYQYIFLWPNNFFLTRIELASFTSRGYQPYMEHIIHIYIYIHK